MKGLLERNVNGGRNAIVGQPEDSAALLDAGARVTLLPSTPLLARLQPHLMVRDVGASSRWYQGLLGLKSLGSDDLSELLISGEEAVLHLRSWNDEIPDTCPVGVGVLIWFETDAIDTVIERAREMNAEIIDGFDSAALRREVRLRDPDGYVIVIAASERESAPVDASLAEPPDSRRTPAPEASAFRTIFVSLGAYAWQWWRRRNLWLPQTERRLIAKLKARPTNPRRHADLGLLYLLRMEERSGPDRTALAKLALRQYEQWRSLTRNSADSASLARRAHAAFEAGEPAKAARYARELLQMSTLANGSRGIANHAGNLVLGRLALKQGNAAEAAERLLASVELPIPRSFLLDGPGMLLAAELLESGEREAVGRYLHRMAEICPLDSRRITAWMEEMEAGRSPDLTQPRHHFPLQPAFYRRS